MRGRGLIIRAGAAALAAFLAAGSPALPGVPVLPGALPVRAEEAAEDSFPADEAADGANADAADGAPASAAPYAGPQTDPETGLYIVSPRTFLADENGAEAFNEEAQVRSRLPADTDAVPGWPAGPPVSAEAAILIEAETGTILYARNIHEPLYPASTTKLMTTLLAFEALEPDAVIDFSYSAVHDVPPDGSNMGMDDGEQLTVLQAMYGVMVASANESASALAEAVSGSVPAFAEQMNARAAELGCTETHFVNANGLHDDTHYTSAHDLALIARAYFSHPLLAAIAATDRYHIEPSAAQPDDIWLYTTNAFSSGEVPLRGYAGGKTGYTSRARSCLVTCCERDGVRLICVVLREEAPSQYTDTAALFEYGFTEFEKITAPAAGRQYQVLRPGFMAGGTHLLGAVHEMFSMGGSDVAVVPADGGEDALRAQLVFRGGAGGINESSDPGGADGGALSGGPAAGAGILPAEAPQEEAAAIDIFLGLTEKADDTTQTAADVCYTVGGAPCGSAALLYTPAEPRQDTVTEEAGFLFPALAWFGSRTGDVLYLDLRHILIAVTASAGALILVITVVTLAGNYNFVREEKRRTGRRTGGGRAGRGTYGGIEMPDRRGRAGVTGGYGPRRDRGSMRSRGLLEVEDWGPDERIGAMSLEERAAKRAAAAGKDAAGKMSAAAGNAAAASSRLRQAPPPRPQDRARP